MKNPQSHLPKEPNTQKVRADAIAILAMGIVASASISYLAVRKYLSLFVAGGIAFATPEHRKDSRHQSGQPPMRHLLTSVLPSK